MKGAKYLFQEFCDVINFVMDCNPNGFCIFVTRELSFGYNPCHFGEFERSTTGTEFTRQWSDVESDASAWLKQKFRIHKTNWKLFEEEYVYGKALIEYFVISWEQFLDYKQNSQNETVFLHKVPKYIVNISGKRDTPPNCPIRERNMHTSLKVKDALESCKYFGRKHILNDIATNIKLHHQIIIGKSKRNINIQ